MNKKLYIVIPTLAGCFIFIILLIIMLSSKLNALQQQAVKYNSQVLKMLD